MILSFLEEYNSNGGSQATCLKNTVKVAIKPSARLVNIVLSVNMQPCALFVPCTTSFIVLLLLFFINTVVSVNINTNNKLIVQILPWTWLRNDQKVNFQTQGVPNTCDWASTLWHQEHSESVFFGTPCTLEHQAHWSGQLYDYSKLVTP